MLIIGHCDSSHGSMQLSDQIRNRSRIFLEMQVEKGSQEPEEQKKYSGKRTARDEEVVDPDTSLPRKRDYRSRAHVNPLSHNDAFQYPVSPHCVDWSLLYPGCPQNMVPTIVDVGCGFGGLTVALATLFPNEYSLGLEIRAKVAEYVRLRIEAHRQNTPPSCQNAAVLRTNSMRLDML